ncbi:hypothetical protein K9L67_00950 [Candidatus Woesearchaeota archaeon]|nr:hypothetical protein [Candidatus Woesearchaeota archaeon]MCF7900771.1 hypothetical protein [Candidatus Woesearchaeota archaeon]MCF8012936.1 hypothetical protein [Candidatus Woesearchaeota archaeon]
MESAKNNNVSFVIAVYGIKYSGMLLTLLYSIKVSNPEANTYVIFQDIDEDTIKILKTKFKRCHFIKTKFDFSKNKIERISSKTLMWFTAIKLIPKENLCFLDVDTLVLKDISGVFKKDFDVGFTYKNEHYPLNTGVLFIKRNRKTIKFFNEWKNQTFNIIKNKELFDIANSKEWPYGGSDQMSFYKLIDYKKDLKTYELKMNKIKLCAFECSEYNVTKSKKINEKQKIIHYKGGWQRVLLENKTFTKYRSLKDSKEMYFKYLTTYLTAIEYISNKKMFRLAIPAWADTKKRKINMILYGLDKLLENVVFIGNTFRRILMKRTSKL